MGQKKNYCLYHPCYNTTIPPCPYAMHCIHVTTMSCKPYTAFSSPKTLPSWLLYYIPCHPYAQALRCPLLCNALPPSHQLLQYDLISCRFMHCYYVLFTEPLPEGIPTTALFPIFTYTALTTIIACNMHVFAKIHLALADSVTY